MQGNTILRSLGIAGVLALGSIVIAYAQQQPAPPASGAFTPPPPPAAAAPVAQLQWPDVDCATAKLTTTVSQPRCQRGPMFQIGGGPNPAPALAGLYCVGEWWSMSTRSPSNFGFVLLNGVRTPAVNCRSRDGTEGTAVAMKILPVARNGTGWSDVNQIGGIYTASFTSAGGENCKAFLKLGPPWESGWLWVVRGWLCGVRGNSVQDRDLQSFVDALIVKAQ